LYARGVFSSCGSSGVTVMMVVVMMMGRLALEGYRAVGMDTSQQFRGARLVDGEDALCAVPMGDSDTRSEWNSFDDKVRHEFKT
jgi:hypothetical protein